MDGPAFISLRPILSLQQIHRLPHIRHPEIGRQGRMLLLYRLVHLPRHAPVGKVSLRRRSQLRDIKRLGKIHLEQRTAARSQRQHILSLRFRTTRRNVVCAASIASRYSASRPASARPSGSSYPCSAVKALEDLRAFTMTMHIAEAANIHQDVKAQRLPAENSRSSSSCRPRCRMPSSIISATCAAVCEATWSRTCRNG